MPDITNLSVVLESCITDHYSTLLCIKADKQNTAIHNHVDRYKHFLDLKTLKRNLLETDWVFLNNVVNVEEAATRFSLRLESSISKATKHYRFKHKNMKRNEWITYNNWSDGVRKYKK